MLSNILVGIGALLFMIGLGILQRPGLTLIRFIIGFILFAGGIGLAAGTAIASQSPNTHLVCDDSMDNCTYVPASPEDRRFVQTDR